MDRLGNREVDHQYQLPLTDRQRVGHGTFSGGARRAGRLLRQRVPGTQGDPDNDWFGARWNAGKPGDLRDLFWPRLSDHADARRYGRVHGRFDSAQLPRSDNAQLLRPALRDAGAQDERDERGDVQADL